MRFLSTLFASALGTLVALGLIFFLCFLFFLAILASSDPTPSVRAGSVLVVDLAGDIPELVSDDPFTQTFAGEAAYDLRDLTNALRMAAYDDRIEAVWLQVRGVSAPWATLQEARIALLDFKKSGKPVFASSDDYMVSEAEYFLASAADSVFASDQGIFEFNGFVINVEFYKNLLDKVDVEPQIIRAGTYKSAIEPYIREDLSPENEEQLAALLSDQNEVFLQAVAEQRGLKAGALQQRIETGAIIAPAAALEAGLLDGLLYRDQVIDVIKSRLGLEADEDLREIALDDYARTSPSSAGISVNDEGEIAVVYAVGTIVSGGSTPGGLMGGDVVGAETFNEAMREARENERVDAVVVRVNSPGGSAGAADAMWREIELTRQQKPVVISMGDVAASGGYWIATAGDLIVADPLTITGSIGVFSLFFDASGLFENKLGITFDAVRTSPYADIFSGLRPFSEAERDLLQTWTERTYQRFLERVSEARDMTVEEVDAIAQGRVWTGARALELGLVDELGDLEDALERAGERAGIGAGPYRIRVLPRPKTLVEQLSEGLSARASQAYLHLRTTEAERRLLDQARTLRHALQSHGTVQARMPWDLRVR